MFRVTIPCRLHAPSPTSRRSRRQIHKGLRSWRYLNLPRHAKLAVDTCLRDQTTKLSESCRAKFSGLAVRPTPFPPPALAAGQGARLSREKAPPRGRLTAGNSVDRAAENRTTPQPSGPSLSFPRSAWECRPGRSASCLLECDALLGGLLDFAFSFVNPQGEPASDTRAQGGRCRRGLRAILANRPGPHSKVILRKEVIQPQVPLRLPCYDLVPITGFIFGACLAAPATSDAPRFGGLTGGVYKAQEHIHRGMLIRDY
jgi:hypothetical protein